MQPRSSPRLQHTAWLGSRPQLPFGGVGFQFYVELEHAGHDLEGVAQAWRIVVERHEMLRCVRNPDGTQLVSEDFPAPELPVHDLRTGSIPDSLRKARALSAETAEVVSDLVFYLADADSLLIRRRCARRLGCTGTGSGSNVGRGLLLGDCGQGLAAAAIFAQL